MASGFYGPATPPAISGSKPPVSAKDKPPTVYDPPEAVPGYGEYRNSFGDLGANWRIKFADADGIPLNMVSFEQIDFGAIAFKEIFQNVKVILSTPIYSAALERLLGVDQSIVDLPVDQAAQATVAILDALYFWEPRVEPVNIQFESDVISGHLVCNLQLNIRNVIYGTETPYDRNNVFDTPTRVSQILPEGGGDVADVIGPPGPPGAQGPAGPSGAPGQRGSVWLTGTSDPGSTAVGVQTLDMYLNTTSGAIFQFDGTTWRRIK